MPEMKYPETPIRILLGGGIGSGKSAVGRRFDELGATVVDADLLGHAVLGPDGEAFNAVIERWPSVVVDQHIDRGALAEIVFSDPSQLTGLETMTHPAIIQSISELARKSGDLVVEIPLILDVPGEWVNVFVDANEDSRLNRAVERGSGEKDVRRRMDSQPSRDEWLAWCDEALDNNGSIESLEVQINSLWYALRTTHYGLQA